MELVALQLDGREWRGWQTVRVERSVEQACSTFSLGMTVRAPRDPVPLAIRPWAECRLMAGSDPLLSGYIERVSVSQDAGSMRIEVSGRSKTLLAVKCSTVLSLSTMHQVTLRQVASQVAKEVGLDVSVGADVEAEGRDLKGIAGESGWALVERLARRSGALVYDDGEGRIIIGRPSQEARGETIEYRVTDVLTWGYEGDTSERYTHYRVIGQRGGTDVDYGEAVARAEGQSTDKSWSSVTQLLILQGEEAMTASDAATRARWEAAVRAGRSVTLTVTLARWRDRSTGRLWEPGTLHRVRWPLVHLDRDMILSAVTWEQGVDTQRATLTLRPPGAYLPAPSKGQSPWWPEDWEG